MNKHHTKMAENFVERWFWKPEDIYLNVSSKQEKHNHPDCAGITGGMAESLLSVSIKVMDKS